MMQAVSNDCFDRELVRWFTLHRRPWRGTASELLAALRTDPAVESDEWPQSARALYSHIESHQQKLRFFGVDVVVHHGRPRMISFRSCPDRSKSAESPPGVSRASSKPRVPASLAVPHRGRPSEPPNSANPDAMADTRRRENNASLSGVTTERPTHPVEVAGENTGGLIFNSTGEALVAIAELRMQIRDQGLDPASAVDFVIRRTQEITRCCGILVGLLQQDSIAYPARTGVAATMDVPSFQANLFQFCLKTGRTMQLRDAQKHSHVGAACREQGIGSLIVVPIFRNREIAGAIEFLFKERRVFSIGDVLDIELVAGVVGESLNGSEKLKLKGPELNQAGLKRKDVRQTPTAPAPSQDISSPSRESGKPRADLGRALPNSFAPQIGAQGSSPGAREWIVLGALASSLASVPPMFSLACKRAWMRCERTMGVQSTDPFLGAPLRAKRDSS